MARFCVQNFAPFSVTGAARYIALKFTQSFFVDFGGNAHSFCAKLDSKDKGTIVSKTRNFQHFQHCIFAEFSWALFEACIL